jgi:hypothetical protein
VPGAAEQIVVPVDVVAPPAQTRVTVAAPQTVYVDRATGQVVAAPVAEAVETSPRAAFRSWTAEDIGGLFGGRRTAAPVAPVVGEVPVVAAPVGEVVEGTAKPSLLDQVRGAFTSARGPAAPVAEVAGEVVEVAPDVAKPSLLEQLRGVGTTLRGPAANGAGEVVEEVVPKAPKGLAAIREGIAGLGALRQAPVREAVEEAVEHTPGLAERALGAFRIAAKVR